MASESEPLSELGYAEGDVNGSESGSVEPWMPLTEPMPEWSDARASWGIWWDVHIYFISALFLLLAIYDIIVIGIICRLYLRRGVRKRRQVGYYLCLLALMILLSLGRAVFLLVDAYNTQGTFPPVVSYVLTSLGLPCLTAAHYLMFHAYMKATRTDLVSRTVFSTKTLIVIIVLHFVIFLTLDIAAGFTMQAVYLLISCQGFYVVWGIVLSLVSVSLFGRIYWVSVVNRRKLIRMGTVSRSEISEEAASKQHLSFRSFFHKRKGKFSLSKRRENGSITTIPKAKLAMGAKMILVSAALLLVTSALYLSSIFMVFVRSIVSGRDPNMWIWWGCEFTIRLSEVGLCAIISVAGTQPILRHFRDKNRRMALRKVMTDTSVRSKVVTEHERQVPGTPTRDDANNGGLERSRSDYEKPLNNGP